jgi:hypothetical protein
VQQATALMRLRGGKLEVTQKAVLRWTKINSVWPYSQNPEVVDSRLVDGMSYDELNLRLVKTYPAAGLRREAHHDYLDLDPVEQEGQFDAARNAASTALISDGCKVPSIGFCPCAAAGGTENHSLLNGSTTVCRRLNLVSWLRPADA